MDKQLAAVLKTLDGVAEDQRGFYQEQEGVGFVLDTDRYFQGMATAKEREKQEAAAAKARLEELQGKFKDLDPDAARKALAEQERLKAAKMISEGKVDELVAQRIEAAQKGWSQEKQELLDRLAKAEAVVQEKVVGVEVNSAALKAKVRPTAVEDVLNRARSVFKVVDGKAVAMNGDQPLFGKDTKPLTIDEWMENLKTAAPHLFEQANGGGTPPGAGKGGPGAPNLEGLSATKKLELAFAAQKS